MDWYDPQNWCGGFVPLSTSAPVLIPLTANQPTIHNIGADIDISGQITLEAMATLTLQAGPALKMSNSSEAITKNGAIIILEPNANYNNSGAGIPALEVRQLVTGEKGWRMIGTPILTDYIDLLDNFETQGFQGSTNPSLQSNVLWWDETNKGTTLQAWRQPSSITANAPAGRGHYFYVFNGATKLGGGNYSDVLPKIISVTGSEVNLASGIFTFPVTFTARDSNLVAQADTLIEVNQADEGFNLIANPTASTIDFHSASGWTKTNIDETIYVWDPATEAFLTWNGSTGSLGNGRVAPYQAFWVKANAASPALQISNNNVKTLVSTDFYGRKLEDSPFKIDLQVTGEGMEAKSFISFDHDGKDGADPKDAYQLESLAEDWLLLYTYGSIKTKSPLVINNLPELGHDQKVIPLHLAASKKGRTIIGSYLMDWKLPAELPVDIEIVLMDHIQKKAIDMRKESMHSFSYQAPEIQSPAARKSQGQSNAPKAVIFQSPFESGEVNARTTNSTKLQRPFTIYIGSFPEDRFEYLPDFPKLFAPVPNPFSDQTKISFYLPVPEKGEVLIYDMLGKPVGNFPAQDFDAGIQELQWIPTAIYLPNGLYIIRLSTSTGQFTQKLIKN